MNRMSRRTAARALPCLIAAAIPIFGALWLSAGSSTTTLIEPLNTVVAPVDPNVGTAAGAARTAVSCGFADPCDANSTLADSIARVNPAPPPSPNPNSCWYCLTHGVETTYTQWFIGIDYASPLAVLEINAASPHEPVLRGSGSGARLVLARHGYDLEYAAIMKSASCVSAQDCLSHPTTMILTDGSSFTMSGETWEVVPFIAERFYAHTDNSWSHFGETRSQGVQKVLIGLEEIVLH
jgi:hypothetical protein